MIRKVSSLAFGAIIALSTATAFAQDEEPPAEGGGDDAAAAPAEGGDAAAPAEGGGGEAAAGGEAAMDTSDTGMGLAVGADLAFMMPLGNFGDATGPMFGALLKLEYPVSPSLGVTGRAGFLFGLEKETGPVKTSISDVPLWAGVKYYVMAPRDGLWLGAELGLNYFMVSATTTFLGQEVEVSDSEAKFGAGARAGYRIGAIDIGAGVSILDLGEAGDSLAVLGTVGYDFMGF